jgi:uncharacterized protein (DUF58 family)
MSLSDARKARRNLQTLWELAGALILLAAALLFALASRDAVQRGHGAWAITFSLIALFLAVATGVALVPRLARRIDTSGWKPPFTFSFTGLGGIYIVTVFLIALAAINTGNNMLFMVLAALLSAVIISGVSARAALRFLSVSLHMPENVFEGESVGIKVSLENRKRFIPSFSITVEDAALRKPRSFGARIRKLAFWKASPEGNSGSPVLHHPAYFPVVPPGESRSELVSQSFTRRGYYCLDGFHLSTRYPFGLFRRGERMEARGEVLVYPSVQEISAYFHLLPFLPGILEGQRSGQGESLHSIRKYQEGESARLVDWKATAKTNELMARQYAREEESKFCLILDTILSVPLHPSCGEVFERAVSLAASLAVHFSYRGAELEFLSPQQHLPRGIGPDYLYRILRSLAIVDCKPTDSDAPGDIRRDLAGAADPKTLDHILSEKVFKIIITSKPRGGFPAAIWHSSHVIYFDEL